MERQRALGRTTIGWSAVSIAGGLVFATRQDRWWRAFGQQHVGWGVMDLLIVAVAARLQARRMGRLPNLYDPVAINTSSGPFEPCYSATSLPTRVTS